MKCRLFGHRWTLTRQTWDRWSHWVCSDCAADCGARHQHRGKPSRWWLTIWRGRDALILKIYGGF